MYPEAATAGLSDERKTRAAFYKSMEEFHRNNESQNLHEQFWRMEREVGIVRDFIFKEIDKLQAKIAELEGKQ